MKNRIDFICIGSGKSGTTYIAEMLRAHPQIFIPKKKELNYFNSKIPQDFKSENINYSKNYDWYHSNFDLPLKNNKLYGDISPCYQAFENCSEDIYKYNKNIKLFIVIRSPVRRTFSQYFFSRQNGIEKNKTLNDAIKIKPEKYITESLYHNNLSLYLKFFKRRQIKIIVYENFFDNPKNGMKDLYEFLEVDSNFECDYDIHINKGKTARFQFLNIIFGQIKLFLLKYRLTYIYKTLKVCGIVYFIKIIKKLNLKNRSQNNILDKHTFDQLIPHFIEDIEKLENNFSLNLSEWKYFK